MKRHSMVAVLAVSALALAACGGDDDDSADPTTPPAPTEAPDTTDTTDTPDTPDTTAAGDSGEPGSDWPDKLVFAFTPSDDVANLVESAEPLAALLEEAIGVEIEAVVPDDFDGPLIALGAGQADILGGLGASQMPRAADEYGGELILQSVRFGYGQYVTQWFTNDPDTFCADEPVANDDGFLFCNGVDQLTDPADGGVGLEFLPQVAGKTMAIVSQGSASGFKIPALELLEAGVDPFNDVELLEAGAHDSSVQAVYDGDADVGVSFNDARGGLADTVPDVGEKVIVFAWSEPIPNDGFAVNADLPEDLKTAITEALISIAESEEGAELLDTLYEINGLVPVDSSAYDVMRGVAEQIDTLLG